MGHQKKKKLRRPGIEPGSQEWESCMIPLHQRRIVGKLLSARLAQSVEHETLNLRVVGSSPTLGEIFCFSQSKRVKQRYPFLAVTCKHHAQKTLLSVVTMQRETETVITYFGSTFDENMRK